MVSINTKRKRIKIHLFNDIEIIYKKTNSNLINKRLFFNGQIKEENFKKEIGWNKSLKRIKYYKNGKINEKHFYLKGDKEEVFLCEKYNIFGIKIENIYYIESEDKIKRHHYLNKPNQIFYENGQLKTEMWYINGIKNRIEKNKEVIIEYNKDGDIIRKRFSDEVVAFCKRNGWDINRLSKRKLEQLDNYLDEPFML